MLRNSIKRKTLEELPKFIYKYFNYDSNLLSTLNEKYFYYSKPKDFNDPFDCNIKLIKSPSIENAEKFLFQNEENLSREQKRNIKHQIKNNPKNIIQTVLKGFELHLDNIGICCFSKEKNQPLMWAHYTNKHQGIMLELQPEKDLKNLVVGKVEYNDNYNTVDITNNLPEALLKFIMIKSMSWKYENEYRSYRTTFGKHKFNPDALISITLGLKFDKRNLPELKKIMRKNYPNADIYETIFLENKMELTQQKVL